MASLPKSAGRDCIKSAIAGDSHAAHQLGANYGSGEGIQRNDAEAVKWYSFAAGQGDDDAMWNLGLMVIQGAGVEKRQDEGLLWIEQAAECGCDDAVRFLVNAYKEGEHGCPVNEVKAQYWHNKLEPQIWHK